MERQLSRTSSKESLNQSMDEIAQQVNQLMSRSNSPSLLQQLEPSTTTTQQAVEQTTPMTPQSYTPSAVPVPTSSANNSDTDSSNGSFEIISHTELVLQDIQPSQEQINEQIIQAQQQQASNSSSLPQQLKPILKQSTDDSSECNTDCSGDMDDSYAGDINLENIDINLPVVEQTTSIISHPCMPPAIPDPSSTINNSDTDDNCGGNVDLDNMDVNSLDVQQSLPQSELKQSDSTLKELNLILNLSTASTQPTVEQTTPTISQLCKPPTVFAPSSTNNDSDTDSYSDLDDIYYETDDDDSDMYVDMSDGDVNLKNMDVNLPAVVEQTTPITSHSCVPPAVPNPSSANNNSNTNDNYDGNINLENMDINSQDAQQLLPQSKLKLILKQLDSSLKQLNSILNTSTASTQATVEQTTSSTSQLCIPPAVFAPSSTNNDSDMDDTYRNVDLEKQNIDVNSQDTQQSLLQSKLILKQLDSTLKQLNSILNPNTASTQSTVEQTISISSQPYMPPPILAPNVTNNSSNMNVKPANMDFDFEGAQLRLRKRECNFICNRLRRLEEKLTKSVQPKNAFTVLYTIMASTSNIPPRTIEWNMLAKSSFITYVEFNGKHYRGKGLSKSLARQDAAEKILKDLFFEKMTAKSKTGIYGRSDTQANSFVNKKKEMIDAQNATATVTSAKKVISWRALANFALYKLILDWNNERTSNSIVKNIRTQNEICQETIKQLPVYPTSIPPVELLYYMQPNLIYVLNRIGKVPHEVFTVTTKINGMEFSGTAATKKDAKIKVAKTALLELYNVNYTMELYNVTPE